MNALDQYLQIYDANASAINHGSAGALNALRPAAREALEGARLPRRGDEGYEKTSVDEMFAADYGININRVDIPVDIAATFRCDVPNISTLLGVVINDHYVATSTLQRNCPEGLTVMSLAKAAAEYPELVEKYYGRLAPLSNPGVALNSLLLQDGVFVHVGRGVKVEKALQIVNIFSSPTPLLAPRRIVVALEEEASLQMLVCDHTQDADQRYLSSQVVEIFAAAGSRLDYYDIEETSPSTQRYCQLYAAQATGSDVLVNGVTLTAGRTRNEYSFAVDGDRCETRLGGMAIATGHMHVDNASQVTHVGEHCHSDQLFKYVVDDHAQGAFEGAITVTPTGRFTEAYQTNRNILASPDARMHSKPQLLIFDDDVKCSHGSATGQLDQNALFYMRTRGIPLEEARTMLMQAFMADVIAMVRLDTLRDRLTHLVENRFAGKDTSCDTCRRSCGTPKTSES